MSAVNNNNNYSFSYFKNGLDQNRKETLEQIIAAIEGDPEAYLHASERIKNEEKVALSVLYKDPTYFKKMPDPVRRSLANIGVALDGMNFAFVDEDLQDKKLAQAAIVQNANAFKTFPPRLKNDLGLMAEAILRKPKLFKDLDPNICKEKAIVHYLLAKNPWIYEFFDWKLKEDFSEVAFENNGLVLAFAPDHIKRDRKLVTVAIKNTISALGYADSSLLNDQDFMISALMIHLSAYRYASDNLKEDEGFNNAYLWIIKARLSKHY